MYEMVSYWSSYEKLVCPHCIKNNKVFTLMNGGKVYLFIYYYHWRFFPSHHRYINNIKDFLQCIAERDAE